MIHYPIDREYFRRVAAVVIALVAISGCQTKSDQGKSTTGHRPAKGKALVGAETPAEFTQAQTLLIPVIRARSHLELERLKQRVERRMAPYVPYEALGEHLAVCIGQGAADAELLISQELLEKWGVNFRTAMEIAHSNLRARDFHFASVADHVYMAKSADGLDVSRLLLTDAIRNLAVNGDPVAVLLDGDSVYITGSEDDDGLGVLADLAGKFLDNSDAFAAMAVRLDGKDWVSWMPDSNHPQYERFRILELRSMSGAYADQKALLDALHVKQGIDIFVANYSAVQKDDGKVFSYCVWGKGVDAYLPKTQKIMFYEEDSEKLYAADWDAVQRDLRRLIRPLKNTYPPRWRARNYPTQRELDKVRDPES